MQHSYNTTDPEYQRRIRLAADKYLMRQLRTEHPEGDFDEHGMFWPALTEYRACCRPRQRPTKELPFTANAHCRTLTHCALLYDVHPSEVRTEVKRRRKLAKMRP